jgi:PPM family protein phosphatase
MMLIVEFGAATDAGLVRERNEDRVLAEPRVFAVADGMGGHAAGDVASSLAVARLRDLAGRDDLRPEDVRAALDSANAEILASMAECGERTGMATTVAGLGMVRVGGVEHWVVFNVGDSRVYRFADGALSQVSVDHSEVEERVAAGRLTREEARWHPLRHVVTRSLGTEPGPVADLWVFPPAPGERFLLCSDGLPLELDDVEIRQVLVEVATPQQAADQLVARALLAGGRDNVTVVVVDVVAAGGDSDVDVMTVPRARLVADG